MVWYGRDRKTVHVLWREAHLKRGNSEEWAEVGSGLLTRAKLDIH